MSKTCYTINFYLGDRRKTIDKYTIEDRLYFLKQQINTLEKYFHSLSKIIFNFNIREEDYKYVSQIFNLTPKYIQGAEVEINFRPNYGMSYAAWSEAFDRNEDKYDYFIFNEDDYFFIQNNWDSYLVNKFNSYDDCGFICPIVREPHHWNDYKKHAGHATTISSNKVLKEIKQKHGSLPHGDKQDYHTNERLGQIGQSFSSLELGYNIYDIRDDYRVSFAWTENDDRDIWRHFWWNEKDLIEPAFLLEGDVAYNWFESYDGEFLQKFKPTTREEALFCYYENQTYFGEKPN